ncbi:MAG: NADPH:quinone reductase [Pirellulales bacterium]
MKAAYIHSPGPSESIEIGDLPIPEVGPRQALVRVHAAAVNPVDTYIRSGTIAMELPRPFIVGCDLAGVVETVGAEVNHLHPGMRVWGSNQGLLGRQGTFAEYAAVDSHWLYPTPDGVSDEAAAAGALVGITAHLGLVRDAQIQEDEILFVNGGTGGVGSAVVQMAKALGARVITTAGTDEKVAMCRELGADLAINYRTEDVDARIREYAPNGVHVWWETLREPDFDRAVSTLTERGRMVVMAGREARPQFPVGPFYVKGCRLYGFVMFKATPEEQGRAAHDINRWLADGRYRPRIARTFTLDQVADAHRLQEENTLGNSGTLAGKIVVRVV